MTVFPQALFSGLLQAGLLMAVAVGLALVFGVMGVVNFAHGALLMAGMYAAVQIGDLGSIWVTTVLLGVLRSSSSPPSVENVLPSSGATSLIFAFVNVKHASATVAHQSSA